MKNFLKNLLLIFLIFLIIAGVFSLFTNPQEKIKEVTLSELVAQINEEKIKAIVVNGSNLDIILKDNAKEKSTKEEETALTQSLKNYGVDPKKLQKVNIEIKGAAARMLMWSSVLSFLLPLLLIGLFIWWLLRQAQKGQMQALSFGHSRARIRDPKDKKDKVTFKDVAGIKEAKEELKEIVEFLRHPRKFLAIGAKIPKGVLLMGPTGCGKTLLARAVAGEAKVPFFHLSGSEFIEMLVGVGAARVRDLFRQAKKNAPAIVFIDEIDAVGRVRGAGLGGGHDEREQTLNQILVEMDGFETNTQVIVMAATNRPDILDPALLRPGRFDRRIVLEEPDIKERVAILKIHAKNKPLEREVNLQELGERTPGFSGADLANLVNEAAILAARRNKKTIGQKELLSSIEKVLLGPERKSHILTEKEKEIAAFHEAGHALVAASLPHTDPVHKISIISRGRVAGYTLKLPKEDKHLRSKSEFLDDLTVLLGGYTAEKLVFNELTTGAANDLKQASGLARKLVTQYGMSEKLGPITFEDPNSAVFLGKELSVERNYSEKIAAQIDKEVGDFIEKAYQTAQKIIGKRKEKLNEIAKRLIEKETIERKEFEELMA